ncbi:unnamed protein product [Ilex paraguariensis]|uniref:Uncharacterized protein n=1 Tax=Ilex paraguariensis TaxID=185542 RepID=A0ABC8SJ74_9AQUA
MEDESSSSLQLIEENVVTEMMNVIDVDESKVGMMFESYKQLLEYYTGYSKSKSTSKNPLKLHPSKKVGCKAKDCRPSESDAIGLVDGQPTSEAIDVLGTQENIGMTLYECYWLYEANVIIDFLASLAVHNGISTDFLVVVFAGIVVEQRFSEAELAVDMVLDNGLVDCLWLVGLLDNGLVYEEEEHRSVQEEENSVGLLLVARRLGGFFGEEARRSCGWCRLNDSGSENVRRRLWGRNFRAGWGERM